MSVEQDIGELKTDIKWIKQSLQDIKKEKQIKNGYMIGLMGSIIISITSIVMVMLK